jgi:hypothetical protein
LTFGVSIMTFSSLYLGIDGAASTSIEKVVNWDS